MITNYDDAIVGAIPPGVSRPEICRPAELSAGIKPFADAAVPALLLGLASPFILLAMVLVKLTSRGPVIYRQVRVGHEGRHFTIYKIRTMYDDCERDTGPQWAKAKDPRITPVGRVLRRTHLDELPQLWNVLRGEMGLIGPRPERPEFVEQLEWLVPDYRRRLGIRPGITGLAQVQLPADTDLGGVNHKLAYDLCYIERAGLWLDLRILVATVLKMAHVPRSWSRWLLRLPSVEPPPGPASARARGAQGAADLEQVNAS